jgi:hypothetical protein
MLIESEKITSCDYNKLKAMLEGTIPMSHVSTFPMQRSTRLYFNEPEGYNPENRHETKNLKPDIVVGKNAIQQLKRRAYNGKI